MPDPAEGAIDSTTGSLGASSGAETLDGKLPQAAQMPRKTQRAPLSCSYCAQRKIKCEKVFPCKSCIRKGRAEACTREVVAVKGKVIGGPKDSEVTKRAFTVEDYADENRALRKLIKKLTGRAPSAADIQSVALTPPPPNAPILSLASGLGAPGPVLSSAAGKDKSVLDFNQNQELYMADLTTVGMEPSARLADSAIAREASPDISYLIPFAPGVTRSSRLRYLLSLVPVAESRELVALSLRLVGWIHGALLHDVFLQEHDEFLEDMRRGDMSKIRYEWLSVYFAVLASGSYFLGDAWDRHQHYTPQQRLELPRAWFSASLETLYLSEFLTRHTLNACQCICILTLCAFTFGASGHLIALLHVGLKIAQTLGLHILVAEPENEIPAPGLREREIGRAIWGALSLGDALSPASQQPHSLFLPEALSVPQANLSQHDLVEGRPLNAPPLSTWTLQSKHIFLNHCSRLFRRFNREFWAANSLEEQYRLVEEADARLLAIIARFPRWQSDEPYPVFIVLDGEIPYRGWMEHDMIVSNGRLRMSLHRCFLRKSYEDVRFIKSRRICLETARGILRERQRVVPALFDRGWHLTSDTVAAGVILCAIYREERDPLEKRQLHEDVLGCINVLAKGGAADNNLVSVGINLLYSYLGSTPAKPSAPTTAPNAPETVHPPRPAFWQAAPPPHAPQPVSPTPAAHVQNLAVVAEPALAAPSSSVYDPLVPIALTTTAPPPTTREPPSFPQSAPWTSASSAPASESPAEWTVPDLWSSLESAGGGGAFDPFGGWEGAASLEWVWPGPSPPPGAEYDPSRPAF